MEGGKNGRKSDYAQKGGRVAQNSLTGCGYERLPSLIGSPPVLEYMLR